MRAYRDQWPAEAQTGRVNRQQNGPSPLLLRRHSLIPMVQSAQDLRGDQLGGPGNRSISLRLRNRRVAIQALMGPGDMVVLLDELPQQPLQVVLPQDDHMVQKLSA